MSRPPAVLSGWPGSGSGSGSSVCTEMMFELMRVISRSRLRENTHVGVGGWRETGGGKNSNVINCENTTASLFLAGFQKLLWTHTRGAERG